MKIPKQLVLFALIALPLWCTAQTNPFLKKYAGTYQMGVTGSPLTAGADKYILMPDGKCTWIMTMDGKTERKAGAWKAQEGLIKLSFDMGGEEGSELISNFQWEDGLFRGSEGIYLKKKTAPAAKATPKK